MVCKNIKIHKMEKIVLYSRKRNKSAKYNDLFFDNYKNSICKS